MAEWSKKTLKLPEDHGWEVKPGYNIFVADRGAVRFDFPEDWVIVPVERSIRLHDRQPPDDNCTLEVSVMYLPDIDWSGLSLRPLLQEVLKDDSRGVVATGEIVEERRPHRMGTVMDLAWVEVR